MKIILRFSAAIAILFSLPAIELPAQFFYGQILISTREADLAKKNLVADLYTTDISKPKPVILIQTPYDKSFYRKTDLGNIGDRSGASVPFDSTKYNYVVVDWRGFYANTSADIPGKNRGEDGYDIVEWIAVQSWCNGRVGTWGGSALGQIQFQTAALKPPHLVCCAPFIKDFKTKYGDFYYGGAYRKEHVQSLVKLGFTTEQLILSHPSKDALWTLIENQSDLAKDVSVPMFLCSGWFDHFPGDVLRAFSDLKSKSDVSVRAKHKLLFGPYTHMGVGSNEQGILSYPSAEKIPTQLGLEFFNFYLSQEENAWEGRPNVQYYQMGENSWKTADSWRSVPTSEQRLYLREHGELSFEPPPINIKEVPPDTLIADPRNPVPTIGGSRFQPFKLAVKNGPQDNQSLLLRKDILSYSTETLTTPLVVAGSMKLHLIVQSRTRDADVSVRLCDVYPDGRWVILSQGILRLRYRNSFSSPTLLDTANAEEVTIELQDLAQTFLVGHKLGLIVSGSNDPMFDVNLNNGGELYKAGDTITSRVLISSTNATPSKFVFGTNTPSNSVESTDGESRVSIYPNPSRESIIVSFRVVDHSAVFVRIYNSLGTTMKEVKIENGSALISIADLPVGLYCVKVGEHSGWFLRE